MSFRVHIAANYSALPVCFLLLAAGPACAQPYPAKSIRVVVGFQAGGGVDMSARAIGKYLTEAVGQPIVVDNKPGAAGNIAANLVAKSTADGYTLLMSNSTIAIPSLFANLPFDVRKDFDPVSLVAIGPSVLTVTHQSCKSEAQTAHLWFRRRRQHHASRDGAAAGHDRHPDDPRAVQRQRAVGHRSDGRRSQHDLLVGTGRARADQERPHEGARSLDLAAQLGAARRADA
jgi:tripartite-type tricarboxylate transporter receptor subunit TctC